MSSNPWEIVVGLRKGHAVAVHPATGIRDSVRLRPLAQRMAQRGLIVGSEELYSALDQLDDTELEVSGKIARKIKSKVKKAAKKVVKTAKKVANSKVVKTLYGAVKKALPTPYKEGLAAVETGVRFAKDMTKKGSPAAKALPTVKALASGQITRAAAEVKAKALGLKPADVVATGVALKLRADAQKGEPKAVAIFQTQARLEAASQGGAAQQAATAMAAEAQLRASFPSSKVVNVEKGGRRFATAVIPLS